MISNYLNQSATWKRKTGDNEYGEPVFAAPVEIKVRWEGLRRLLSQEAKELLRMYLAGAVGIT